MNFSMIQNLFAKSPSKKIFFCSEQPLIYIKPYMYMPPSPTVSTAPNTMPSLGGNGLIFGSFTAKIPQINAPSARINPINPRPPTLYPPSPDARNDWITAVQNTASAAIAVQKDKIPVGECFKSLIRVFRVRRKYSLLLLAIRCLLIYLHDMFTPIVKSNSDLSLFFTGAD